jgi:hypothetical protein
MYIYIYIYIYEYFEEEEFYIKYLKYKTKYLQIKNEVENVIGGYPINETPVDRRSNFEKNKISASKCGMYIYLLNTSNYVHNKKEFKKDEFEVYLNNAIKDNNSGYEVDKYICNIMNYFDQEQKLHERFTGLECAYMQIQDSSSSKIQNIYSIYNEKIPIELEKNLPEVKYGVNGNVWDTFDTHGINVNNDGILTGDKAPDLLFDLYERKNSFTSKYDYYFVKQFSCGSKKVNNEIKLIRYDYNNVKKEKEELIKNKLLEKQEENRKKIQAQLLQAQQTKKL